MEQAANNQGAMLLSERILSDARAQAAQTRQDAKADCDALLESGEKERARIAADWAKKRELQVQGILDGCHTSAMLDGKKDMLAKKREVLDQVFEQAYQAMLVLPQEKKLALYCKLLSREAVGGEEIRPAKAERELVGKAVVCVSPDLPRPLHLSDEDAAMEGGFLLVADGYEKDCSMRAVVSMAREAEESNIFTMLFA